MTCDRFSPERRDAHEVLLVSADPGLEALCRAELVGRDMSVHVSPTFDDGIAYVASRPSLILVDHDLADGDGLQFARIARRRGYGGPLLLVSDPDRTAAGIGAPPRPREGATLRDRVRAYEQRVVCETFAAMGGSSTRTAAALGIDRVTLWRKLRSYASDAPSGQEGTSVDRSAAGG